MLWWFGVISLSSCLVVLFCAALIQYRRDKREGNF